jgi:hypothetical protein
MTNPTDPTIQYDEALDALVPGDVIVFEWTPSHMWVAEVIDTPRVEWLCGHTVCDGTDAPGRTHRRMCVRVALDRAQFGKHPTRPGDVGLVALTDVIAY